MKYKRFLGYGAVALTLLAVGVAFIRPVSTSNMLFRSRAALNVTAGTITFDGSNASTSGTTTTTVCNSRQGGSIICKTFDNDSSQTSNTVGAPKLGSYIRFYESDGTTQFTFEDLDYINFIYTGKFGFWLHVIHVDGSYIRYGSSGAGSANPYSTSEVKQATGMRSINFSALANVSQIWVECTSTLSNVAQMTSIQIVYNCNSKSLTGVEITQAPTKTSYLAGESFDPTGMIFKVLYSNGTSIATTAFSVYPSVLSTSDTSVTISYGGFSATQAISVTQNTYVGTYLYTSGSATYTIELNSNFTGLYHYVNTTYTHDYQMHFTYSIDSGTITFNKDAQTGDSQYDGGYYNLFTTDEKSTYENQNSAAITTAGNVVTIKLYTCASSSKASSSKSLVKQ